MLLERVTSAPPDFTVAVTLAPGIEEPLLSRMKPKNGGPSLALVLVSSPKFIWPPASAAFAPPKAAAAMPARQVRRIHAVIAGNSRAAYAQWRQWRRAAPARQAPTTASGRCPEANWLSVRRPRRRAPPLLSSRTRTWSARRRPDD